DCCEQGGQKRGKCIPRDDVPESIQSRLTSYECDAATELCMPTENIDLEAVPTTCVPTTTLGGRTEGVCVSRCLVFSYLELLTFGTGTCRTDQICAPCINPQTGQPTGLPGCK